YVIADGAAGGWRCFAPGIGPAGPDTDLRMLVPVEGRIALRFSSATPWISWKVSGQTEVTAPAAGQIDSIGPTQAGLILAIRHDAALISWLLHLDRLAEGLDGGASIGPGQLPGVAGGHGDPALQILLEGRPLDPMPYLGGAGGLPASAADEGLINR